MLTFDIANLNLACPTASDHWQVMHHSAGVAKHTRLLDNRPACSDSNTFVLCYGSHVAAVCGA